MSKAHVAYLNLGSNIQPETNLPKALKLLSNYGEVRNISNVWESKAVGTDGPNYLNLCILFRSSFSQQKLKEELIQNIESELGRKRSEDKFAARTIDIDIVLFDEVFVNKDFWKLAYVVVPLADIYPEYRDPETGQTISEIARRLRLKVWLEARQGVLD